MAKHAEKYRLSTSDFLFGRTIGRGSLGHVIHARLKRPIVSSSDIITDCSIKIMEKRHILKEGKQNDVMNERALLSSFKSDLVVKLYGSFQCERNLYLVLDLCEGGNLADMTHQINATRESHNENHSLPTIDVIRYYAGQILRALEYIHSKGVIHRDIKPENILITKNGRIKLADFGAAHTIKNSRKLSTNAATRKSCNTSFVGSAAYVSPEVLRGLRVNVSADIWAFGCTIFFMMVGQSPFECPTEYLMFNSILNYAKNLSSIEYPSFIPEDAKMLISKLLIIDPERRLGSNNVKRRDFFYSSIRNNIFFKGFAWDLLNNNLMDPPFSPKQKFRMSCDSEALHMRDGVNGYEDFDFDEDVTQMTLVEPMHYCYVNDGEKKCEHEA